MNVELLNGDAREILKTLADNSIDSIVTDPPYELGFMGKVWDNSGIAFNPGVWKECLRVLKPGGHLLSFGGSRTYHRMASAIEDAGFEIRDQIMWLYGSGFPKSMDVSKAIDKAEGVTEWKETKPNPAWRPGNGDDAVTSTGWAKPQRPPKPVVETDAAKQWAGWGTALKPAHEPIVVARKPLIGTVAANVLAHGTGALNIDASRVATNPEVDDPRLGGKGTWGTSAMAKNVYEGGYAGDIVGSSPLGRWPANVIHDGSDEVVAGFPHGKSGAGNVKKTSSADQDGNTGAAYGKESRPAGSVMISYGDEGSASRFFYCAKAAKKDRDEGLTDMPEVRCGMMEDDNYPIKTGAGNLRNTTRKNTHPTVKPTELMRYLVKLVTPPGGTVLDPFTGSGSTGKAAKLEGFSFIGVELNDEYLQIARARIENVA